MATTSREKGSEKGLGPSLIRRPVVLVLHPIYMQHAAGLGRGLELPLVMSGHGQGGVELEMPLGPLVMGPGLWVAARCLLLGVAAVLCVVVAVVGVRMCQRRDVLYTGCGTWLP